MPSSLIHKPSICTFLSHTCAAEKADPPPPPPPPAEQDANSRGSQRPAQSCRTTRRTVPALCFLRLLTGRGRHRVDFRVTGTCSPPHACLLFTLSLSASAWVGVRARLFPCWQTPEQLVEGSISSSCRQAARPRRVSRRRLRLVPSAARRVTSPNRNCCAPPPPRQQF